MVLGRTWIITTMTSSTVSSSASPHPHTFNFHYGLVVLVCVGPTGTLNIALVVGSLWCSQWCLVRQIQAVLPWSQFSSNPNRENIEAE